MLFTKLFSKQNCKKSLNFAASRIVKCGYTSFGPLLSENGLRVYVVVEIEKACLLHVRPVFQATVFVFLLLECTGRDGACKHPRNALLKAALNIFIWQLRPQ